MNVKRYAPGLGAVERKLPPAANLVCVHDAQTVRGRSGIQTPTRSRRNIRAPGTLPGVSDWFEELREFLRIPSISAEAEYVPLGTAAAKSLFESLGEL
jgi:hypothetical protein